jgi:hypothetical protein
MKADNYFFSMHAVGSNEKNILEGEDGCGYISFYLPTLTRQDEDLILSKMLRNTISAIQYSFAM